MDCLITFSLGVTYACVGGLLTIFVSDIRGSRLAPFIGRSVSLFILTVVLFILVLPLAVFDAHWTKKRINRPPL